MFLGTLLSIFAIVSFFIFILYVISDKTIKFMYFFYANLIVSLPLCLFALLLFFDYNLDGAFYRVFFHLVDLYCVVYIGAMFFIVLRGIFFNKNVRMLDYTKILIPLFMAFTFLLIKTYGIDYISIFFILDVGFLFIASVIMFPISFLSYVSFLLLTKHVFEVTKKEDVYLRNEKAIRFVCLFLFVFILIFLIQLYYFHKIIEDVFFVSIFSYVFLLFFINNIFKIVWKESLYLKRIQAISIIRILIAWILIVIFFVYLRVS